MREGNSSILADIVTKAKAKKQKIVPPSGKLKQTILYIERNPETVKSITSFPLYGALTVKD